MDLTAVSVKNTEEYLVGDAGGQLWYTLNGGSTWTEKTFPGSGSGSVEDISFATKTVGYMSHTLAGAGRIFRTIDGGNSWYLLPEGTGTIPTNAVIHALDACGEDVNILYAGGLTVVAGDGIILKVA